MTTFLLIRHATNDYVKSGKLAGRLPGIHLSTEGQAQAQALAQRLATSPIKALYASPMERTMQTATAIAKHHPHLRLQTHHPINEVDYGHWTGMSIATLQQRKMWPIIQQFPSRASFPNGETLPAAQSRAVTAIENLRLAHPQQTIALVFHADLIKLTLAHFLGMHIDLFQRITISPASISALHLEHDRPMLLNINDAAHLQSLNESNQQNKTIS